jgi:hypothetical protein
MCYCVNKTQIESISLQPVAGIKSLEVITEDHDGSGGTVWKLNYDWASGEDRRWTQGRVQVTGGDTEGVEYTVIYKLLPPYRLKHLRTQVPVKSQLDASRASPSTAPM